MVGEQELPRLYVRTNFKERSFIRLQDIEGSQNFEIGQVPPGYAHVEANLWSMGKNCPGATCVPNLKSIALSVFEILRGPKFQTFSHVTQAT